MPGRHINLDRRLSDFLFNRVIKPHPVATILSVIILMAICGSGARSLKFDTDYRMFFDKDNPQLASYETLQKIYSKDDAIVIAVSPPDGQVFNPDTLRVLYSLSLEAWQLPYSTRVDSLTNFSNSTADEEGLVIYDLLEDIENLNAEKIDYIQRVAETDPAIKGALVSQDGRMSVIKISFALPGSSPEIISEVVSQLNTILAKFRTQNPKHQFRASGNILAGNTFAEAAKRDIQTLIPLMYGMIILVLFLAFRSWLATCLTLINVLVSSVIALGMMGWIGWDLSSSTAIAPTVIMTLAVADAVHLLSSHFYYRGEGFSKIDSLHKSIQDNLLPMALTSITTIIGFLSLNFNKVPPFRELGNIVSIGVIAAFVAVVTLIPAFIVLLPDGYRQRKSKNGSLKWITDLIHRHKQAIFWTGCLAIFGSALMLPQLVVNDDVVKYFDQSFKFRNDSDAIIGKIGGFDKVEYSVESGESQGVLDPAYLSWLQKFIDFARNQKEVAHVSSIADTFRKINQNLNEDKTEFYRLPETREQAAQFMLLYEMSLPQGRDLTNQINIDRSSSRVSVSLWGLSTIEMLAITQRLDGWLVNNPYKQSQAASGTGLSIVFANIYKENIVGMIEGTLMALCLITLTMIIVFRSWSYGLLSILPNIVPIVLTFGVWAVFNGVIDLASSAIAMLALGIVVDDTVHFLSKYLSFKRRTGCSNADAVSYVVSSVGKALWITSAVLFCGFFMLAFSGFKLNMSMGILTSLTIVFALVADLFFLPALLLKFDRSKNTVDSLDDDKTNAKYQEAG